MSLPVRALLRILTATLLLACGCSLPEPDHGPAPGADIEEQLRARREAPNTMGWVLDGKPSYRLGTPTRYELPRHLFDREVPGEQIEPGFAQGWRVDFWVTEKYVDQPQRPEMEFMAFFRDGKLRGIFRENMMPLNNLDRWHVSWVDFEWQEERIRTGERKHRPAR